MDARQQEHDIDVQITNSFDGPDMCLSKLKKLVRVVCARFGLSKVTVSIAIVGDEQIRKSNKQFLGRDFSTDCLSFDLSDDQVPPARKKAGRTGTENPGTGPSKLFELVVNAEKAVREASLRGHSAQAELALYIVHGLLHNLGFDDSTPEKAKKMHSAEDEILNQLGFGIIYNS